MRRIVFESRTVSCLATDWANQHVTCTRLGKLLGHCGRGAETHGGTGSCDFDPNCEANPMSTAPPTIQDLARRLLALEAARDEANVAHSSGAARVCDRLRVPLARLAGTIGFRSLLSRALVLAKAEDASLNAVQVREDGSLEGFGVPEQRPGTELNGHDRAGIVAHLLGLLATFIGEPLTRQLVCEEWPDAVMGVTDGTTGGQP